MKKRAWSTVLILTFTYSYLFYKENIGINCFIFTVCLGVAGVILNRPILKNRSWLTFFVSAVFLSVFIWIHPSNLAVMSWILSVLLMIANSSDNNSSILVNLLHASYAILSALPFLFLELFYSKKNENDEQRGKREEYFIVYLILGIVVVAFLAIYKTINPLFDSYTKLISFDFLTPAWLFFTSGGLILMFGLIRAQRIPNLDGWEADQLSQIKKGDYPAFSPLYLKAFVILFSILNCLLVLINLLDIQYLYLGKGMPAGITHKQFVHNGVGMLNLSVLLGIFLILIAFSRKFYFNNEDRILKRLVYIWIGQNILMIVSTGLRNQMYVLEALLTYKRILVFYWLGLTASLLITTLVRIHKNQPSWKLIRTNSVIAFILLLASSVVDWDLLLSNYNFSRIKDIAGLDKRYLIDISEGNIPLLYQLKNHPKFEIDSVYHYNYGHWDSNKAALDLKLYHYLNKNYGTTWKSHDLRSEKICESIKPLNQRGLIDTLDLSLISSPNLVCLEPVSNIKFLYLSDLTSLHSQDIRFIDSLPKLESLFIRYFSTPDTIKLREFKKLKALYLTRTIYKHDSVLISKLKLPYRIVFSQ